MVPTVSTAVVCQLWHYQVAQELEEARGLAGELAVAEERLRFAGELHDIQGGNLQAITLKSQVARRLVAVDPERAEAEMRAVEELARAALKDTREVVGGYRKVALADEIDSAARILEVGRGAGDGARRGAVAGRGHRETAGHARAGGDDEPHPARRADRRRRVDRGGRRGGHR